MKEHPYYTEGAFDRLLAEYLKYDTLYIAFDFDNTIWDYDTYGDKYEDNYDAVCWEIVELLKGVKQAGLKLILWTSCPKKEDEDIKAELCTKWGIKPDYINYSPLSPGAVKPHFNLLLDDRAGLESAAQILSKLLLLNAVYNYMENKKEEKQL